MKLRFDTDSGAGSKATLGLIVLQTDETIEPELAQIVAEPGVALYHNRIPMVPEINAETLLQMKADLPQAAALFPSSARFDVIGYGCTSASTVIGPDGVRDAIRQSLPGVQVTEPLSALIAGCRALGLERLGFVTPYVPSVSARMQEKLEQAGHQIVSFGSFEEGDDRVVARITESSISEAIQTVAGQSKCDGVIVACTNLRVAHVARKAEAALGIPILSSNLALAWHMLSLAGITPNKPAFGRLHSGVQLR